MLQLNSSSDTVPGLFPVLKVRKSVGNLINM